MSKQPHYSDNDSDGPVHPIKMATPSGSVVMFSSRYFQHAFYSIACLSISINLVGMRRSAEEDRARVEARLTLLESIREQLGKGDDPNNKEELERLMRLSKRTVTKRAQVVDEEGDVSWSDIFSGKTPKTGKEDDMSRWEKEDLEKRALPMFVMFLLHAEASSVRREMNK